VHIIVNNQIGFTTSTKDARSTFFPTDVAKMYSVPIFHVNGDDPSAVIHVVNLALNFRQEFGRDAVVDIFCYRRHGHNEGDEPSFTHPQMYRHIKDHPSVASLYGGELAEKDILTDETQKKIRKDYREKLGSEREGKKGRKAKPPDDSFQSFLSSVEEDEHSPDTAVDPDTLQLVGERVTSIPDDFHPHRKLKRIVQDRTTRMRDGGPVDYALAETLAFGTLLLEGYPVRLSGEDSGRGTFSQRHAVWWDIESQEPSPYVPLNNLQEDQAVLSVYDSPLSEYAVLGFEYGYSLGHVDALVMWEAQFGDFANGAQVVIDNYIVSGESKWRNASRLTMLLPHGYEGQGPEHSSAHLERYLQLCARDNIQVCNTTTPAQYFHLLRRQVRKSRRTPLILMTPKSLLRHQDAVSSLADFSKGGFREVMDDAAVDDARAVRRVVFCSGKLYYDLVKARQEKGDRLSVALVRVEQLYPFPDGRISDIMSRYEGAESLVWVQEEPMNRGPWAFIRDRFRRELHVTDILYCGRPESASPATGSHARHKAEQEAVVSSVFSDSPTLETVTKIEEQLTVD
jgi:2-oxoglutarate dehydrogenase E1 component